MEVRVYWGPPQCAGSYIESSRVIVANVGALAAYSTCVRCSNNHTNKAAQRSVNALPSAMITIGKSRKRCEEVFRIATMKTPP